LKIVSSHIFTAPLCLLNIFTIRAHFVDTSDSFACTKCAEDPQDYDIITQISRVRF